jgi:primosomal protein N' (replication factor Y)
MIVPTRPLTDRAEDVKLAPAARQAWNGLAPLGTDAFPATARDLADRLGQRSVAAVNRLIKAGLLAEEHTSTVRAREHETDSIFHATAAPEPTREQHAAIEAVAATLGGFARHLLFGVTGSGKTEVYLRLLARVLELEQTAIMLVPEIALTPQTAGRVQSRLGSDRVAVLHSGLTAAQRNRAWARVATGDCRVVVGARSAVFAPLDRLGLIIVDEEHDGSYKQDQLPRYHARDVAIKRAQLNACPVLMGSATPSLESWHHARAGRASLHRLTVRATGAVMPQVQIVDMAAERRLAADTPQWRSGHDLIVGPTLRLALRETLALGGQALLLLNRRGFAGLVACAKPACGFKLGCNHCDASLVLHRDTQLRRGGYVRCHHCQAEQLLPERCPDCRGPLRLLGVGTQRAEEALEEATADLPESQRLVMGRSLLRVDADTMRSGRDYFETIASFARGQVLALVGTQMIAKGLDVPGVRLVGVLSADTALSLPDFRAAERTFQLVSQVAGRAGRGELPGRVIVQTYEPTAAPIALAAAHQYERFADAELSLRTEAALPPVWRMARIVCRDTQAERAHESAETIAQAARALAEQAGATLLGPMPCPIERIADHFRVAVELTAPDAESVQRILSVLREQGLVKSDAATAVDVDPVSLM